MSEWVSESELADLTDVTLVSDDEDNGQNGVEDDEWWRNWKDGRRFHRSTDEAVKYAKYVDGLAFQDAEHNHKKETKNNYFILYR